MEKVWHQMLDNDRRGLDRFSNTLSDMARHYNDPQLNAIRYTADLGIAYVEAAQSRPATDQNIIGTQSFYYEYDRHSRGWNMVSETNAPNALAMMSQPETLVRPVTDPQMLAKLDDARAVRMERNAKAEQVAPGDPYVAMAKSPSVLANTQLRQAAETQLTMRGPSEASHPEHGLYAELKQRLPHATEDRLMQFTAACHTNKITADNLATIHLDEANMRIGFRGTSFLASPAVIDLNTPPPHHPQSTQQLQHFDQQQAQMTSQIQVQIAQTNAQGQHGPMMGGR